MRLPSKFKKKMRHFENVERPPLLDVQATVFDPALIQKLLTRAIVERVVEKVGGRVVPNGTTSSGLDSR